MTTLMEAPFSEVIKILHKENVAEASIFERQIPELLIAMGLKQEEIDKMPYSDVLYLLNTFVESLKHVNEINKFVVSPPKPSGKDHGFIGVDVSDERGRRALERIMMG